MSDIAKVLKSEIQRLARKEVRSASADLKNAGSAHRSAIADLRRRVTVLESENKRLLRHLGTVQKEAKADAPETAVKARITGKMIKGIRAKLGLSQSDLGKLLGVTTNTVYLWEQKEGRLTFRGDTMNKIVEVRGMKKAQAQEKLGKSK
jgi:DNA-binding transcriptional regulator YiaG